MALKFRSPIVTATLILLVSCKPQEASQSGRDWDQFVSGFVETYFEANPLFAVYQGRHEFDGRFPDWSDAGLQRWIRRLHQLRDSATAFTIDASDSVRGLERDYLTAVIDRDLFWQERADWPHRSPSWYADQIDPNVYLARSYAPLPERMRAYTRWAQALPLALKQMQANLQTPMPRTYADIGRGRIGGMASYLERDVPVAFDSVADSVTRRSFTSANAAAIQALKEMDGWLAAEQKRGTNAFAIGPELFRDMLRSTEMVDMSLDSLEAQGRADLERNLAALKVVCREYAPRASLRQCVDRMSAHKPRGGAVAAARAQLDTLEQFVRAADIVSVPGRERALVREAPPYQRFNFAYIDIPGPYEKNIPSIYYIAPPDTTWSPAEQAAYVPGVADLLFTSVHEVWPGHFLNFLHSNRAKSKFGQVFVGYAFSEGWAHYTEEMMLEAGLGEGDPEAKIGQLSNALLRNARYLSAIGLHTKGMTVEESEKMFREEAFQDPGNARQQAARGTYDPAYLNYTLGKLMIRKLREDWTADRGGRKAWKQFHDSFLSYGGPPIPLVRRAMVGSGAAGQRGGRAAR
ncbi:MAG TPA: DUF885 domain-containing protein [Gemmatimonadales bacterium]|nr:DUF885 domain-containing protein [Gemmatimonadales bacterium]